jgi:hypothetical protein
MQRRTIAFIGLFFIFRIMTFMAWGIPTNQAMASGEARLSQEKATLDSLLAIVRQFDEIFLPPVVLEIDKLARQLDVSPKAWTDDQEQRLRKKRAELNLLVQSRNSAAEGYNKWSEYLQAYKGLDLSRPDAKPRKIILVN